MILQVLSLSNLYERAPDTQIRNNYSLGVDISTQTLFGIIFVIKEAVSKQLKERKYLLKVNKAGIKAAF